MQQLGELILLEFLANQYGELVAAHPRNEASFTDRASQALRNLDQNAISASMAEPVVDLLQPVNVDRENPDDPAILCESLLFAFERVRERTSRGNAGEDVHPLQACALRPERT
jgi:hypothetical protein